MKNLKYAFAAAFFASAAISISAQELNSEFTVTHQVVPEERAATRLQLFPSITLPSVNAGRLPSATLASAAPLSPVGVMLEPAPWQTTSPEWPWRGYASLSYGPVYNLNASAGYRAIASRNLTLDAFMQFNGYKYQSKHPDKAYRVYGPQHLHRNSFTAGLRSSWTPLKGAVLNTAADYSFSAHNIPMPVVDRTLTPPGPFADPALCVIDKNFVNHNGVNISADWRHAASRKFTYTVAASYGLTAFSRYPDGAYEHRGTFGTSLRYDHGRRSHWQLDLNMQLASLDTYGHKGVLSVHPFYLLTLDHFSANIGVKIDWRLGNILNDHFIADGTDIGGWIYPDLKLNWRPSAMFDLWARFDGRTDTNTLASLFESQPYNYPVAFTPVTRTDFSTGAVESLNAPIGYSRIYNLEAGMTIGPWKGASISLFAGFNSASDWLMPSVKTGYWDEHDVAGAHYGFAFDYAYRSYLSLNARLEFSTADDGDFDTGYYLWRDHAKMDFTASVLARPIQPLAIRLAYHLRTDRSKPLPGGYTQDLYNISDLDASASYGINKQWTVSLTGENLLNHIYYLGPAIPAQGIRGMIGASYKF